MPLVPIDEGVFGDIIEELLKMFIDEIGITFVMKKSNNQKLRNTKTNKNYAHASCFFPLRDYL